LEKPGHMPWFFVSKNLTRNTLNIRNTKKDDYIDPKVNSLNLHIMGLRAEHKNHEIFEIHEKIIRKTWANALVFDFGL
jgi:hypothetical protein